MFTYAGRRRSRQLAAASPTPRSTGTRTPNTLEHDLDDDDDWPTPRMMSPPTVVFNDVAGSDVLS